jgi:drug/metabolite transporter (DMT)-like permease
MKFWERLNKYNAVIYLLVSFSMICWAFSFVWYKLVYIYLQPLSLVFLRLVISTIFLFTFGLIIKKMQGIKKGDWGIFLLLAFFEPLLYFLGESFGVQLVSSTLAAVIVSTIPLFSPVVGYLFQREKISILNLAGIVISVFGVILVVKHPGFSWSGSLLGIMLLFLAVFAALGYSVIIARLSKRYNSITIISWQNLIGVFYFLPLFLIFEFRSFREVEFSANLIRPLIYLAVFASSLAFITFVYGVQKLGITRANIFVNLIPVFTAIFAWYILKDKLYYLNIIGILVVVGGLFLSQIRYRKKSTHSE